MLKEPDIIKKAVSSLPRLAFLGAGWIGKNRMDAIAASKSANIAMIIEPDESIRESLFPFYSESEIRSNLKNLSNKDSIDGVIIATPNALHAAQSIQFLEMGVPVFCQKPLGRNAAETYSVVEAAKKNDTLLGVDFSYRYTNAFIELNKVIRSGEIGNIFAVDLAFHNAYGPGKEWFYNKELSGGGCVIDLGIHLIDLALYSMNFPDVLKVASSLYSKGTLLKSSEEIEDYASALIQLDNDVSLNLNCSWNLSAGCDAVIEVSFHGSKGGVSLKNKNGSFYDFQTELYKGTGKTILSTPPDEWSGRAAVEWVKRLKDSSRFDNSAYEFIKTAGVLDKIYEMK
jgi:predicted dehydrogenase